jgi:transposase
MGDSRIGGGLIQGGMEGIAMPAAVRLREDYSAEELRALARRSKTINQSRRLLSLAAVRDGMDPGAAAKIGGMDRQTLRDWVHRFNASGPEGQIDNWTDGPKPRLSAEQLAQFGQIVEAGPDREKDGVVRWRRIDLSCSTMRCRGVCHGSMTSDGRLDGGAAAGLRRASLPRRALRARGGARGRLCAGQSPGHPQATRKRNVKTWPAAQVRNGCAVTRRPIAHAFAQ